VPRTKKFDPRSLAVPMEITPKIHIRTKRLSLAEAKAFHSYPGVRQP